MSPTRKVTDWWWLPVALAAYCAVILVSGTWLVPKNPVESWLRELLHLGAMLLVVMAGTRRILSRAGALGLILLSTVVVGLRATASTPLVSGILFAFFDTALVAGCIGGGQLVSRLIRAPNVLLPVGVVAALVDPLGVYLGFTGQAINFSPEALEVVSLSIPTTALPDVPFITLGPGDILFTACFLACLYKFRLNVKLAVLSLFCAVAAVFALLLLTPVGDKIAIPGLPFIACATLLPSAGAFSFSKDEKRSLLIAAAIFAPLLVALILFSRHLAVLLGWR